MFKYDFPGGEFKTKTTLTETGITFDPPVYEQRYCATIQILEDLRWTHEIKKVAEFGCAEMRFFQLMRRIETIEHILQVDVDGKMLANYLSRTNPLVSDYLKQRAKPLHVEVLEGNAAVPAEELRNVDAVIGIELIEHVLPHELAKIPYNIFGFIQPKIVILSTPNADYNVVFRRLNSLLENGFRHWDHKFEWTQEEFKSWCLNITKMYPNYEMSLIGLGEPPLEYKTVGYVSQMALFVRKDMRGLPLAQPLMTEIEIDAANSTPYKCLHKVDFPYYVDSRSQEEKIWSEVEYEMRLCAECDNKFDSQEQVYKLAVDELLKRIQATSATRDILNTLFKKHNIRVKNDFIIIEKENSDESDDQYDDWLEQEKYSHLPETEEESWDG